MDKVRFDKVPPNCKLSLSITTRFGSVADYKGYWIGVDEESYIICRINGTDGNSGMQVISEGCEVNVRFHWNGNLVAFSSQIVSLINEPARWMILSFPMNVMRMPLRKTERYECYQEAALHLDAKYVLRGILKDISETGCKFVPQNLPSGMDISMLKGKTLQIQTRFPKRSKVIILSGIIRNTPNERGELALGLQFVENYSIITEQIELQLVDKVLEKQQVTPSH